MNSEAREGKRKKPKWKIEGTLTALVVA